MDYKWRTPPHHQRHHYPKHGRTCSMALALAVCLFLAVSGYVGVDSLLRQARQSVLALQLKQGRDTAKQTSQQQAVDQSVLALQLKQGPDAAKQTSQQQAVDQSVLALQLKQGPDAAKQTSQQQAVDQSVLALQLKQGPDAAKQTSQQQAVDQAVLALQLKQGPDAAKQTSQQQAVDQSVLALQLKQGPDAAKQTSQQQAVDQNQTSEDQMQAAASEIVQHRSAADVCAGRRIFIYDLPPQYNTDLIKHCKNDKFWPHMCEDQQNGGLGEHIALAGNNSLASVLLPHGAWHVTSQFNLGVMFHERLKRYPCLTDDPAEAMFAYIPFYSALDLSKTIFSATVAVRDRLSQRLIGWLQSHAHWRASGGHNHVIVLGRIIWDYARKEDVQGGWGNAFLSFPEMRNVMKLSIERAVWCTDQMAIPYPTSFHPYLDAQVHAWQTTVASSRRDTLALFAGAPRNNTLSGSLRGALMRQCLNSPRCTLLSCRKFDCAGHPEILTGAFLRSIFCLQPPGDSATRKGVFDCLTAGSIPVLFDERSAHTQYVWHLPVNRSSYSVMFDQDKVSNGTINVINELQKIPPDTIASMQETIRELVPGLIYRKPGSDVSIKDAFDLTIDNLLERFRPKNQKQS